MMLEHSQLFLDVVVLVLILEFLLVSMERQGRGHQLYLRLKVVVMMGKSRGLRLVIREGLRLRGALLVL